MVHKAEPVVSVILCTFNPDPKLLHWALESVENQTVPKEDFEIIVVDNNSDPPLLEQDLKRGRRFNLKLVKEEKQGLSFARCAGISEARAELLVFMDDDNHLEPAYLENALKIAEKNPEIGLFGGISKGILKTTISPWKEKLLPYLGVRDYGPEPITSNNDYWGKWEPIGAGMVARRSIALEFVRFIDDNSIAAELGRKGQALLSGEDSLFARLAVRNGYMCSYQPSLRLSHFIKDHRLSFTYLSKTLEGHGRSYVVLQLAMGNHLPRPRWPWMYFLLLRRLGGRVKANGLLAGLVHWFWDYGYVMECRKRVH